MSHYFKHKAVTKMFSSNIQFYEEIWQSRYDIFRFARKMLRKRWSGESTVRFLAFGVKHYKRDEVLQTLNEECPHWESEFVWQVLCWEGEGVLAR